MARTKALSAKDLSREVKNEAPLSTDSEAISTSLKRRALYSKAKLRLFQPRSREELYIEKLSSPSKAELKRQVRLAKLLF